MKTVTLNTLIIEPNQPFYSFLKTTLDSVYYGEIYRAVNYNNAIKIINQNPVINLILFNNKFADLHKSDFSKMHKNFNTLNDYFLNCIYYKTINLIHSEEDLFIEMLSEIDNSPNITVECNNISNIGRGVWFGGSSISEVIKGNVFTDCLDGIFLNFNPGIGPQQLITEPSDNVWIHNNPVEEISSFLFSYYSYGSESPFYFRNILNYNPSGMSLYFPEESPYSAISLIESTSPPLIFNCNSKGGLENNTDIEEKIATQSQNYKINSVANKWSGVGSNIYLIGLKRIPK